MPHQEDGRIPNIGEQSGIPGEKSEQDKKEETRLDGLKRTIIQLDNMRDRMHPNTPGLLIQAGRRDLAEAATEIMLNDNLRVALNDPNFDNMDQAWQIIYHAPGQAARRYLDSFSHERIQNPEYHRLAQGLIKLLALKYELQLQYDMAAETYKAVGMNDKVQEMKTKFEEVGEVPRDKRPDEDMNAFAEGLRAFQDEFKGFPLMSEEQRNQTIQHIRSEVEAALAQIDFPF